MGAFFTRKLQISYKKGTELIEADYHFTAKPEGIQLIINKAFINVSNFLLEEKGKKEHLMIPKIIRVLLGDSILMIKG